MVDELFQYVCERYHFKSVKPISCLNRQKLARLYPMGSFRDCLYCDAGAKLARENGLPFYAKPPTAPAGRPPGSSYTDKKTIEARQRMESGCRSLGYPDLISCLHDLYMVKKLGTIEIGKALGVTAYFVRRILTENGIETRKPGATKGVTRDEQRKAIDEVRMLKGRKTVPVDQLQVARLPLDEA